MSANRWWGRPATTLAACVARGELSAEQAVESGWEAAATWEGDVHAVAHADATVRATAARTAPPGPLRGVPVIVKDNLCTAGASPTTYGRLSRYGLVAFGSSLDQVGLFARHAGDVALLYSLLAGPDLRDATTRASPPPDVSAWDRGVKGLSFGWPENLWREGVEPEVV